MTIDQAGGVREHGVARRGPANAERSFGISVGTVLLAIGAYLLWRGRLGRAQSIGALGALLLILGLLRPAVLKWPSMCWWRFSRALGYVNSRLLLTVIFVIAFVPIGVLSRLTRHDPLRRSRGSGTGWAPHPSRYRNRDHYSRMY
jgi:saxitoxin biosynthesis operon SxtJ-like protein